LISDHKVWVNVTTDHTDDWDVALGLLVANYAAIDQLDAKAGTSVAKRYGSRDAMIEAGKKQNALREVVASKIGPRSDAQVGIESRVEQNACDPVRRGRTPTAKLDSLQKSGGNRISRKPTDSMPD
jgi:hypothetical protein